MKSRWCAYARASPSETLGSKLLAIRSPFPACRGRHEWGVLAFVLVLVLVLAERTGTDGAIAQAPPDISVAIAGVDGTAWEASAIGGHVIPGTYSVANPKRPTDLGAFIWDGSRLQLYPVVVFDPGIDAWPDNAVAAVNAAGANELRHMSSSGGVDEDRAARFAAGGKTTFVNQLKPGTGIGRATAVDARGNIVGYTANTTPRSWWGVPLS